MSTADKRRDETTEPSEPERATPDRAARGGWTHGPASGVPASGISARGTRPPFAPGNAMHLTHGSRSPRVYLPLAEHLAAGLLDERPDLAAYPVAVARWAEWEARAVLMRRHLAEVGDLDGTGPDAEPRKGATKWLRECENAAERAAAVLGLDPRSEASLARERAAASLVAVDLEAIAERGREALARRVAAGEVGEPDPAGALLSALAAQSASGYARSAAEHDATTTPNDDESEDA